MSSLVLWLDTQQAKMFFVSPSGIDRRELHAHGPIHPPETLGRNHTVEEKDETRFFHELAESLRHAETRDGWFLLGPGVGRLHFQAHLTAHHPELSKKILGSEKMDAAGDAEILGRARTFFHRHNLFQGLL